MNKSNIMRIAPEETWAAEGHINFDNDGLTPCQWECIKRTGMTLQMEQEAYITKHPEVPAMLTMFIKKMVQAGKRKDVARAAAEYFTRPAEVLDTEIRQHLSLPPTGPYTANKPVLNYDDVYLENDLKDIMMRWYPPAPWEIPSSSTSTMNTVSSSFLSIVSSATTVPTPEPIPTPDPTLAEILFTWVSNAVDKAIYFQVKEYELRYDTAYVELMKAVEEAMEVPVIEIREDIAEMLYNSYKLFELNILEKERIAAEIAWGKRMRKKLKRSLRRQKNFKGYETPPTPKSTVSSHESYLKPPQKPCECQPQFKYNRYAKDRFGIYLPRQTDVCIENVTATPAISIEDIATEGKKEADNATDKTSGKAGKKKTTFESK